MIPLYKKNINIRKARNIMSTNIFLKGSAFMAVLRYPARVQWKVTSECNHDCIHCYNYWRKDKEKASSLSKNFSTDYYLSLAQKIIEQKPVIVTVTGGEPLLVFEKIKPAVEKLLSAGIKVTFNTNAALLTSDIIKFFEENDITLFISFPCGVKDICDTITNQANSFDRIVSKLDLLKNSKIKFTTNIVVTTLNLPCLKDAVSFLKTRYISITRAAKPANSDETFDVFLLNRDGLAQLQTISVALCKGFNIHVATSCPYTPCSIISQEVYNLLGEKNICTAGKTTYAIDIDGNVKACLRDSHMYGNIFNEDFGTIWERIHILRDDTFLPPKCKECNKLNECLGGCRVSAFTMTGSMNGIDDVSNFDNIPIKFERPSKVHSFANSDLFMFNQDAVFVFDKDTIRVSVDRKYAFLTQKLYSFLKNSPCFSFEDFLNFFKVDTSLGNNVIGTLLASNIVINA